MCIHTCIHTMKSEFRGDPASGLYGPLQDLEGNLEKAHKCFLCLGLLSHAVSGTEWSACGVVPGEWHPNGLYFLWHLPRLLSC